jgi:hypothetical protein
MGSVFKMVSDIVSQVNQQPTQPTGITSIPVTNQNPTVNMTGGRFNQVRDPRLNRVASRPMFRTPQMRPTTDSMGRNYSDPRYYKMGGRVNYQNGGSSNTPPKFIPMDLESVAFRLFKDNLDNLTYNQKQTVYDYIEQNRNKKANGGRIGYADGTPAAGLVYRPKYDGPYMGPLIMGGPQRGQYYDDGKGLNILSTVPTANIMPGTGGFPGGPLSQQESIKEAIMSLPQTRSNPQMNSMRKFNQVKDPRIARLLQQRQPRAMGGIMNLKMGGMPVEMDLRAKGGFVPIGKKERADDVPARLSKNEFVFTANAVRNAGGGDIRKGAKRMYNLMNKLEAKR